MVEYWERERKSAGTVHVWKCMGTVPELDGNGLDPSAVRVRGNRVVVWEKSIGRISRYTVSREAICERKSSL